MPGIADELYSSGTNMFDSVKNILMLLTEINSFLPCRVDKRIKLSLYAVDRFHYMETVKIS